MVNHAIRGKIISAGPHGVINDGVVEFQEKITWIGAANTYQGKLPSPSSTIIVPGFVDVHCHGGGGFSFPDDDAAGIFAAASFQHSQGTTTLLASLVSAPYEKLIQQIAAILPAIRGGYLAGIHLEGPFINTSCCGAHNPDHIIPADVELLEQLLIAGDGHIRSMTLAPEIAHLDRIVELLYRYGAFPSWGHTLCDDRTARAALELCCNRSTSFTHLFNAMRPFHHRDPGIVGEALLAATNHKAIIEIIADGIHIHPTTIALAFALCGAESITLVSDAIMAAGMPPGDYRLGSQEIEMTHDRAYLRENPDVIAGSVIILSGVIKVLAGVVPLSEAVISATAVPARLLGLHDRGMLDVGKRADIVILDSEYELVAVYRNGMLISSIS